MCPFNYWRTREGNSECTGVVSVFKVWRQKDGQKQKGDVSFKLLECCQCHQSPETKGHMYGKGQKDMCSFRYWSAREGNSDCTGKFHQSSEIKKSDL